MKKETRKNGVRCEAQLRSKYRTWDVPCCPVFRNVKRPGSKVLSLSCILCILASRVLGRVRFMCSVYIYIFALLTCPVLPRTRPKAVSGLRQCLRGPLLRVNCGALYYYARPDRVGRT